MACSRLTLGGWSPARRWDSATEGKTWAIHQIETILLTAPAALRPLARRIQALEQEIEEFRVDLDLLTQTACTAVRQTDGIRVDSAATLLTAASRNPERLRGNPEFTALCGVNL